MNNFSSSKALVLGGGGSAGNAWLIGILTGLTDGGLDVTDADLIIGTSAGATAAAQITGAPLDELYRQTVEATPPPRRPVGGVDHLERTNRIIAESVDAADMRRRMGASALEVDDASDDPGQARWRVIAASRLPRPEWPEQRILLTAVDAESGEPVAFDRDSGVALADAVAASTAGGPAVTVGGRRYIDGGYRRSSENADLARGHGRVLVLSPLGGRTRWPEEWDLHLAAQVAELEESGSVVESVFPDAASLEAFGENLMDLSTRPAAATAGRDQGRSIAERLARFWRPGA